LILALLRIYVDTSVIIERLKEEFKDAAVNLKYGYSLIVIRSTREVITYEERKEI